MGTSRALLEKLGLRDKNAGACSGPNGWIEESGAKWLASLNPSTGETIGSVAMASDAAYDRVSAAAASAFQTWREVPAPKRGDVVRDLGNALRGVKEPLGDLVSLEAGKIRSEGLGEVQEMIDICDFAVGLSRQLYGLTLASERPGHRMMEQWQPLGPVGVISAFNFPVAVWSWNAALAAVCGDPTIWKPAAPTPLCAVAVQHVANRVMADHGLTGIFSLVVGSGSTVGERMIRDTRLPLISFTGSTAIGRRVAAVVAERFRALHSRARRQQRHHRLRGRAPRFGDARDRLRRRRHRGPAMHIDAAPDRAQVDDARSHRFACACLQTSAYRRSARDRHVDGTAD